MTIDDSARLYATAIHEAGHAVAAIALGLGLESVCIEPQEIEDGVMTAGVAELPVTTIAGRGEQSAMPLLITLLAGGFATAVVNPCAHREKGYARDHEYARAMAAIAVCTPPETGDWCSELGLEELERNRPRAISLLEAACSATVRFVEDNWHAIEAVADRLFERKKLTGAEVAMIEAGFRSKSVAIDETKAKASARKRKPPTGSRHPSHRP